jgi:rare lipoprotein A
MHAHSPSNILFAICALVVAGTGWAAAGTSPQERVTTWRTVVIPLASVPQPVAVPRPLTTASLPLEQPARPLVGIAHALDGIASFYWQDQMTASGERFDKRALTAAHRTLPFGTRVRVTHAASGRSVIVRINDRGPFKAGRVVDLSQAAAEQIGITGAGLARVKLEVVR